MKILYLNHNIKGEGTYFRAFNFARELAKRGHDMTLITISDKNNFKAEVKTEDGVKIILTPKFLTLDGGGWGPNDIFFRLKFVIKEKYDIIHGFDHKPNVYFPSLLGRLVHKNTMLFSDWADWWGKGGINSTSRIKPETIIEEFLEEDIRKKADGLTVMSRALEKRALGLGISKEKIFYIPAGCSIDMIRPVSDEEKSKLKEKLKINQNKKIIMFIGRGQADLGVVLDSFEYVKEKIECIFIIVGPLEKRYEKRINKSKYSKDIIVTGAVDFETVAEYSAIADVYMMPLSDNLANRGRYPTKIGDYLAGGKPIIANPVGDIKELIEKYECGLLADYNGKNMGECIIKIFKDKNLAYRLGKNARAAAENFFNWEKMTEELERAYKVILNDQSIKK